MRIAVVGSGIAGLTAAWRLGRAHEVELFEARPELGMDSGSLDVDLGHRSIRIDVPLRVFGSGYYPKLVELYREAGIPRGAADYSASYSHLDGETYFAYRSAKWGRIGLPLPDLALGRRRDHLQRAFFGLRLFLREASRLARGEVPEERIDEYLERRHYPKVFTDDILWPTLSAILT